METSRPYTELADVYDFLVPETLLDPAGSVAAFAPWIEELPPAAPVLDCACGPGHLAVGLALAGHAVTATDASPAMVTRARALAAAANVALDVEPLTWDELGRRHWEDRFAAVFCVGNSLVHAVARAGRRGALENMRRVLVPGGRLLITSRNWEMVRSSGSALEVDGRVTVRNGRRGVVIHDWVIPADWSDVHFLRVAVALLEPDDTVHAVVEQLALYPFRHEELLDDLRRAGLRCHASTYADDLDRYLVIAERNDQRLSERQPTTKRARPVSPARSGPPAECRNAR